MTDRDLRPTQRFSTLPLAQREVALLLALSVSAAALFFTTRTLAAWSHKQQLLEAAAWYDRGEAAVAAGHADEGLDALRHAASADQTSVLYALALARGLARTGRDDEAWQILQRLRGEQPEHAEINYRLARLAASRGDPAAAIRYYHNAMYGIASNDPQLTRHAIALELAGVLLDHGDRDRALAELIDLATELGLGAADELRVAALFLRAGDAARARNHFLVAAAGAAAGAPTALAGAGDAAMAEHDFGAAEQYWQDAATQGAEAEVADKLRLVRTVRSADPLAARIGTAERGRRLAAGLAVAAARLSSCRHDADPVPGTGTIDDELARFQATPPGAVVRDPDTLEPGVALVVRSLAEAARRCGTGTDPELERAWQLIGEAHRGPRS